MTSFTGISGANTNTLLFKENAVLLIVANLTYVREFEPLELGRLVRLITFHVTPSKTRQLLPIRDTRCHPFNEYYQDFAKSQNKIT
jgi:hypothetical protein